MTAFSDEEERLVKAEMAVYGEHVPAPRTPLWLWGALLFLSGLIIGLLL